MSMGTTRRWIRPWWAEAAGVNGLSGRREDHVEVRRPQVRAVVGTDGVARFQYAGRGVESGDGSRSRGPGDRLGGTDHPGIRRVGHYAHERQLHVVGALPAAADHDLRASLRSPVLLDSDV